MPKKDGTYFDKNKRTFETRLLFLKEMFENPKSKDEIMKSCIEYKLNLSFEAYKREVEHSLWLLSKKNPTTILKKLNKD